MPVDPPANADAGDPMEMEPICASVCVPVVVAPGQDQRVVEEQHIDLSTPTKDFDGSNNVKHLQHLHDKDALLSEHEIQVCSKTDSIEVINNLQYKPVQKLRLRTPLCRFHCYPKVHPVLNVDVSKLGNEFVKGYREGDCCMYVSLFDEDDKELRVDDARIRSWNSHWIHIKNAFESDLAQDLELHQFRGLMFYIYEGNHRLTDWMENITKNHKNNPAWHISVDCIILDARGRSSIFLNAMHDVNWSTENDHVKNSVPAKIQQI